MALFAFSINKPLQKTLALGHRDEIVSYQNYLYVPFILKREKNRRKSRFLNFICPSGYHMD